MATGVPMKYEMTDEEYIRYAERLIAAKLNEILELELSIKAVKEKADAFEQEGTTGA